MGASQSHPIPGLDTTCYIEDAARRFQVPTSVVRGYDDMFTERSEGKCAITRRQFDQLMISHGLLGKDRDDILDPLLGITHRAMIGRIWALFDTNKSGMLDRYEFIMCECVLRGGADGMNLLAYFLFTDTNGNRRLQHEEMHDAFCELLIRKKKADGGKGTLRREERRCMEAFAHDFMKAADKDNNGTIELEEFIRGWEVYKELLKFIWNYDGKQRSQEEMKQKLEDYEKIMLQERREDAEREKKKKELEKKKKKAVKEKTKQSKERERERIATEKKQTKSDEKLWKEKGEAAFPTTSEKDSLRKSSRLVMDSTDLDEVNGSTPTEGSADPKEKKKISYKRHEDDKGSKKEQKKLRDCSDAPSTISERSMSDAPETSAAVDTFMSVEEENDDDVPSSDSGN